MCEEGEFQPNLVDLATGWSRRQFGALGGAAALAACTNGMGDAASADTTGDELIENTVTFQTADGTLDGFFVRPASGEHPGVIFWPDIAGLREAKRMMARRLAGQGYAALVVNPYYRDVSGEQFADFAAFRESGGFQKVGPWREKLTAEAIMRDARAIVPWLDAQQGVDETQGIGTQGYCMGGPFTVWTAAAVPSRVEAAASFHGGGLVVEGDPMSPHNLLDRTPDTDYLFAIAQNDDEKDPNAKTLLREAADEAGVDAEVEVYGADHGWTVPDSPAYERVAAERAWSALTRLYDRALRN